MDSVFKGGRGLYNDFSYDLRDRRDWKIATIREVEYLSDISAFAVEPTNGLLAAGTKKGKILVFGAPAVGSIIQVHRAAPVKLLQFAVLVYKLICVDDRGTLYVWDLSSLGRPRFVTSEAYGEPICCIAVSPCHSHVFLGLERGPILTYDLLCLHRSPYVIPNLWTSYEQDVLKNGMALSPMKNASELMDIVIHPRDINTLFITYAGGIALFDLTEGRALRHYELIIPPGAPGASGYDDPDVLKARRPQLTALAVHPSGQLVASGHLDGTIAFWAVDDSDRPLMVRTIDLLDINYPDAEKLDKALSEGPRSPSNERLEPIFKLNWSGFGPQITADPYTSSSVLTILGGSLPAKGGMVTTLRIPPLILPSPTSPTRDTVHPDLRKAIVKSLSEMDRYAYLAPGPAADYFLVPKGSPHFNGSYDPLAIIILSKTSKNMGSIEAKEFPPPVFGFSVTPAVPSPSPTDTDLSSLVDKDLASTLRTLKLTSDPKDLTDILPTALWSGSKAALDGDLVRLENEEYEQLVYANFDGSDNEMSGLGRGGIAWVDYGDEDQAGDLLFTKRQAHRLLVTHHRDLTIRFQDISPQLLIGSATSPLKTPFPSPLRNLNISLPQLIVDPCIANAQNPLVLEEAEIQSVQPTSESKECAVVLRSGHVIVFGFDARERRPSAFVNMQDSLIRLKHLPARAGAYQPIVMIENSWGSVVACEMSNIGFLAIAYASGALVIVDMRHPKIIFCDGVDAKKKRASVSLHLHNSQDEKRIVSLRWVICGFDADSTPRVRLLVSSRSGTTRVFTLSQSAPRTWTAEEESKALDGAEHPLPRGSFVISAKNGSSRAAMRATFVEALQGYEGSPRLRDDKNDGVPHCFWVSAGEKGAKCLVDLTGSRAGRVEWGKGKKVESVEVLVRSGAQALVAIMDTREVFVYTLPALDLLHTFQLAKQPNSAISLDDTGDFVEWTFDEETQDVCKATLGTLFSIRRVYDEPVIDFTAGRRAAPSMPPPVPLAPISYLGSWFNFKKGMSGDAIDALLAGPKRPIPDDSSTSAIVNSQWQAQIQSRAQALAAQASQTSANLYNNLTSAMSDRGEMLSGLDERFRSLGDGGRKMMFEAKKLAATQTGKRWFGGGGL